MLTKTRKTTIARGSRPQPKNHAAKQHAPTDAVLTPPLACPLDLPRLAPGISTKVTLCVTEANFAQVTDSMLNLATLGCDTPGFSLDDKATVPNNIIRAASAAIKHALRPSGGTLPVRWWGSVEAATEGTNRIQLDESIGFPGDYNPAPVGAKAVIEFAFPDELHDDLLAACNDLSQSDTLFAYESVCPGFTHMLYTVLDMVSMHIWPIVTPRSLWNDFIWGANWGGSLLCDADIARCALSDMCDPARLEENYGIEDAETAPSGEVLAAFEEEIASTLPGDFLRFFGRAAIGEWPLHDSESLHEAIPDPSNSIAQDLCLAMNNMAVRDWCSTAPLVMERLKSMHYIVREIQNGARLASGTYGFSNPCINAIHVYRFQHKATITGIHVYEVRNFNALLDDAGRSAMENGEAVDVAGWFSADMSSLDKTRQAIQQLTQGAGVLKGTIHLLLDLFWEPQI